MSVQKIHFDSDQILNDINRHEKAELIKRLYDLRKSLQLSRILHTIVTTQPQYREYLIFILDSIGEDIIGEISLDGTRLNQIHIICEKVINLIAFDSDMTNLMHKLSEELLKMYIYNDPTLERIIISMFKNGDKKNIHEQLMEHIQFLKKDIAKILEQLEFEDPSSISSSELDINLNDLLVNFEN